MRKDRRKNSLEKQDVIGEIRRLHKAGEPLNITAVKRNHPELMEAAYAIHPFWGWKQAIEAAGLSYDTIRIYLEPYVECKICGALFGHLGSHIFRKHGVDGPEYRIDYPAAPLVSEEVRARLRSSCRRGVQPKYVPDWEPFMTAEYALDRIWHYWTAGYPVNSESMSRMDCGLLNYVYPVFGSLDRALRILGLDPDDIRIQSAPGRWTEDHLVAFIQDRREAGLPLSSSGICKQHKRFYSLAVKLFGSWRAAVEAAGIDYESVRIKIRSTTKYATREEVVSAIRRRHLQGQGLSQRKVRGDRTGRITGQALFCAAVRDFGSWRKAVEATGLDYDKISEGPYCKPRKYPAATDVLREIRKRKRLGMPLNVAAVNGKLDRQQPDRCLYKSACREFGGWEDAVVAAGINVNTVRKLRPSPYRSRKAVLAEIRRREREGLPLSHKGLDHGQHKDGTLVYSAKQLFGSWRAAIEAAGLDYGRISLRSRQKYAEPDAVLQAIRTRHRAGKSLTAGGLSHGSDHDSTLYAHAKRCFGSLFEALTVAGLDPSAAGVRRRKYPSKETVLDEIRRREQAGESVFSSEIARGANRDSALLYAAGVEFGSWRRARKMAGARE